MSKTISSYSINISTYLVLKSAQLFDKNPQPFEEDEFYMLVSENLESWLEKLDECGVTDSDDIEEIKRDLYQELKEGTYLKAGRDAFLLQLENFFRTNENTFYALVVEAIETLESEGHFLDANSIS